MAEKNIIKSNEAEAMDRCKEFMKTLSALTRMDFKVVLSTAATCYEVEDVWDLVVLEGTVWEHGTIWTINKFLIHSITVAKLAINNQ